MHLLLIDGSSFIFRAYHALPPLTRKSDGLPVGAVSGFCNMLYRVIDNFKNGEEPSHIAVIFDYSGKSFRNDIYPQYKAHRPPAPEDLVPQFPLVREATKAFSISSIEQEGYEADDIIATYAKIAKQRGGKITIISSDKDLMQLIDKEGAIKMFDSIKNRTIGYQDVIEKFGVEPEKLTELQSLAGDSVDNIPGVPGIGVKTAAQLINEYGNLENLLNHAHEIKQNKRRENLIKFASQARISHNLVTLKKDVPLEHKLEELKRRQINAKQIVPFLKAMEFNTILQRIAKKLNIDIDKYEADKNLIALNKTKDNNNDCDDELDIATNYAQKIHQKILKIPFEKENYQTITDYEQLQSFIDEIIKQGYVAIDCETTSLDNQQAELVGISLSTKLGKACYIPLNHVSGQDDIFGEAKIEGQLDIERVLAMLKPILQDLSIVKILQNAKYDMGVFSRYNISLNPIDDTMILSFAFDGARANNMDALAKKWLNHTPISYKEIAGSGKNQIGFEQISIEKASQYAAEDADITLRLWYIFRAYLLAKKSVTIYQTIEKPLIPVLAKMEKRGILIDKQILAKLSQDFAERAHELEKQAHNIAGEQFNLASPKQLGEILFDKMNLKGGKKTKSGAWATGVSVLEELALEGETKEARNLAKTILDWRALSKLKSTYCDALPNFINPKTGRVHTSYHQAAVITGRLSSSDPNLQNIPIRTKDGRKIRSAFVAPDGYLLISADYSQIELRILAHIADIEALKNAFANGLDIHAMTASEIFNVPIKEMDSETRRRAKAINFGIIYGISAFGLARQLGISRSEAGDYIKAYFKKFPGIKDYMNRQRELVKQQGFVTTIFGRKIMLENANSKSASERAFVERVAINAPIQGSAADIIKRAMIKMEPALSEKNIKAKMLLQVHDELVFEVKKGEEERAIKEISNIMVHACEPALKLSLPLIVDAKAATNWNDAH